MVYIRSVIGHGLYSFPGSKVRGVTMGPIWDQQDPGGPHVGPMNFVIWDVIVSTD